MAEGSADAMGRIHLRPDNGYWPAKEEKVSNIGEWSS